MGNKVSLVNLSILCDRVIDKTNEPDGDKCVGDEGECESIVEVKLYILVSAGQEDDSSSVGEYKQGALLLRHVILPSSSFVLS